jgi:uncharacterized protein YqcC (DUF446 family)
MKIKLILNWLDWVFILRIQYIREHQIPNDPLAQCATLMIHTGPLIFRARAKYAGEK